MIDVAQQLADIMRRVRGLKATRPAYIAQVAILEVSQDFALTLASGDSAVVDVTIECAGDPLVDVSFAGLASALGVSGIASANASWTIDGNTASAQCSLTNWGSDIDTRTVTVTAWAINGLSATIERAS